MKKVITVVSILAVIGLIAGIGFAQSDYASRTGYTIAKQPQSTIANINHREGLIVGHYMYDIDGVLATNVAMQIKEGQGYVTMPDNAIIQSNSTAYVDFTTASVGSSVTGTIHFGDIKIYDGAFGTAQVVPIQIAEITKFTSNSILKITATNGIPTNALSVSVYVPYILGN